MLIHMGMVDRYKKSGGFIQLIQVIETCGAKKREQFMTIITQESPAWADALTQKCLTYEKILAWKPEALMEIIASMSLLTFATALKGLPQDQLDLVLLKLSHQEKAKIERAMQELNPSAGEVSSSQMKVISETRSLLTTNALKADKIDMSLVIPFDFEVLLQKGLAGSPAGGLTLVTDTSGGASASINDIVNAALKHNSAGVAAAAAGEADKIQQKLNALAREFQTLKQENIILKDKLEKIRKIA